MLDTTPSDYSAGTAATSNPGDDLIPFVGLTSWIRAASHCHIDIDPLLAKAGVDLSAGATPAIKLSSMLWLMKQCVQRAAPQHYFPWVMGELFVFDNLPAFETFLTTSPTLRQALPALQWAGMVFPHLSLRVEESGSQSVLLVNIDAPFPDPVGRGYFIEAIFAAFSKVVRLSMVPIELIHHIEVRHQPNLLLTKLDSLLLVPLQTKQLRDAAIFASKLLDIPLPGASPGLHQRAEELVKRQLPTEAGNLIELLARTFKQHPALLGQGLQRMADRLGLHPRTLQRRLRELGQQYTDIQAACRLETAKTALVTRQCDIESLSEQLGFSDRHSFTRAFKRWTGLSPSAYRGQQKTTHQASPQ